MPDDLAPMRGERNADAAFGTAGELFAGLLAIERRAVAEHHLNLVQWLIGLPVAADPAASAALVLGYQQRHPVPTLSTPLIDLLRDVSRCPPSGLGRFAANRHNQRHLSRRQ